MNDHAALLHDLNSALASLGFGFVMAVATVIFLAWLGLGGFARSRWALAFILMFVAFFCVCMSMWAQDLHFAFHVDREAVRVLTWSAAGIVAAIIVGRFIQIIVERAPPAALVACLSVLMGCGLVGVLSIWAAPKNLLLLVAIVGLVALVAMIAILAWVLDRAHQRSVQYPRQVVINHAPQVEALPYVDRGRLSAPQKGGLPVVGRR